MNKIIFVKPAPGVRVLDPDAIPPTPLPSEGKKVLEDPYWLRRIHAGEVLLVKESSALEETTHSDKISPNKGK